MTQASFEEDDKEQKRAVSTDRGHEAAANTAACAKHEIHNCEKAQLKLFNFFSSFVFTFTPAVNLVLVTNAVIFSSSCLQRKSLVVSGAAVGYTRCHSTCTSYKAIAVGSIPLSGLTGHRSRLLLESA